MQANPQNPNPNPNPAPAPTPTPPPAPAPAPQLNSEVEALKSQLATLQNQINEANQYIETTSIVLQTIAGDPNLAAAVRSKFQNPNQPPQPQPQPTTPQTPAPQPTAQAPDPIAADVSAKMRGDIINNIEARFGIATAPEDQKKALRSAVGDKLSEWGLDIRTIPVSQLEKVMTDAYTVTSLPKAKEEGKLEVLAEAHQNNMAAIPSMNTTPPNESATLTPSHKEWTQKLDVPGGEDRVASYIKELQDTGVISYKPPAQRAAPGAVPSGNPQPPQQ